MVAAVVVAMALSAIPMMAAAAVDNDERENAIVITDPLPFVDHRDTTDATSDPSDPHPSCIWHEVPIGATVWYRYTTSEHAELQAHTVGSDYDTVLAVYEVGAGDSLTEIACNDDFYSLQSFVTFLVEPDMELLMMVGEYGDWGSGGSLAFTFAEGSEPPIQPPVYEPIDVEVIITGATVSRSSGHVTVNGTVSCSAEASADMWSSIRQRLGRAYITAEAYAFDACGPSPTAFSLTSYYESGVFTGGHLQIRLSVWAFSETGDGFVTVEQTVQGRMAP